MNELRIRGFEQELRERALLRRRLMHRLAGLTGLSGLPLFGLDDLKAKKRKKKRKKRRKGPTVVAMSATWKSARDNALTSTAIPTTPASSARCDANEMCVEGRCVADFGSEGRASGQFRSSVAVTVNSTGNILVIDLDNSRGQQFTSDGQFVTAFGRFGSGPDEFVDPKAIATDMVGRIFVVDQGNHRV